MRLINALRRLLERRRDRRERELIEFTFSLEKILGKDAIRKRR